jgi:hypothetical protein
LELAEEIAMDSIQSNATSRKAAVTNQKPPLSPDIALAYRVNDAAKIIGLSRASIYNLIAAKKLHSIVIGGRRL